jgi:hypothetical protein
MEQVVELPKKYSLHLLGDNIVILDTESRDVCKITLNPLHVVRDDLKNKHIAAKIIRALSTFQAYKTPSLQSFL